jgi:hypothetical protein
MTPQDERWEQARNSLFLMSGVYQQRSDGTLVYRKARPGPGWHAHGCLRKPLWVLVDGRPQQRTIHKQRWLRYGTTMTVHDRPPDDPVLLRCCTLIVVLKLWAWLDGDDGIHRRREVFASLDEVGSERTVQRWMRRALGDALEIQQVIRLAVIERCEPRPVDDLFRGGLSPPPSLLRRYRQNPLPASTLWRAFAMLMTSASQLALPLCTLLAEARGRWQRTDNPSMI